MADGDAGFGDFDLGDGDFLSEGMPGLDPAPDEDAWEAFLTLALERMDGKAANALSNAQLGELEGAMGHALPFEVGMLLVMGLPDGERWWRWSEPADDVAAWNASLLDGLLFDVEHNDVWLSSWGPQPVSLDDRRSLATAAFTDAPSLLPIHGHRAVPLTIARDETSSDSNPVLSVVQTDVITYGSDLAAWLNREFEVPLPMWPETAARWFPFWSELAAR